jgi:hypothetical protein
MPIIKQNQEYTVGIELHAFRGEIESVAIEPSL